MRTLDPGAELERFAEACQARAIAVSPRQSEPWPDAFNSGLAGERERYVRLQQAAAAGLGLPMAQALDLIEAAVAAEPEAEAEP